MSEPVVIVGIGEMGAVFARAFLRAGHPVEPVTRQRTPDRVASRVPEPELVLVTVGEGELHPVLESLPRPWLARVGLLQNELLPRDWERHGIAEPNVAVVWFEKKKGTPIREVRPSVVAGPQAELVRSALEGIDIGAYVVEPGDPLVRELVLKNLYILTVNIAGMETGGTVEELWRDHNELARQVADEVLSIQEKLVGKTLPRDALVGEMVEAFEADPAHKCTGRSAPARLSRALGHAAELGVDVPRMRAIAEAHQVRTDR